MQTKKITFPFTAAIASLCLLSCASHHESSGHETAGVIQAEDASYYFRQGPLSVEIVPDAGGRIGAVQYRGQDVLLADDRTVSFFWGNVFWTSPQRDWGWPPDPVLDSEPYTVLQQDDVLILTSAVAPGTGYQFVKRYALDADTSALIIDYQIHNHSDETRTLAAWEITRVPPSGIALFPTGETEFISGQFSPMHTVTIGDITWYEYDHERIESDQKMMTDGAEGWLAYVNDGIALIKEFADVPAALNVPGEGEIEIYTNAAKTYLEIEQQGPLTELAPGESLSWHVRWHLRALPEGVAAQVGDQALVDWIRDQLGATP